MSAVYARARSKEAPMVGIEFTNRSKAIPAWRVDMQDKENMDNNNNSSLKRSHETAIPPPAPFDPKKGVQDIPQPVFGENLRYLFRPPHLNQPSNPWAGPSSMEIPEVDMKDVELSPPRPPPHSSFGQAGESSRGRVEEMNEGAENAGARQGNESPERRLISNAAVRRIARKRKDGRARSRSNRIRKGSRATDVDEEDDSVDEEDEDGSPRKGRALTRNTSNHYTLNLPGPPPVKTDTPYILLGYLQFMFNLSLILVFLYLLVQFIFTVQHDVEQRIGEYSMDILQEITTCTQLYKQNLCDTSPIPAMLHQCATWETCMNRDPKVVGRARVGAEMLAEVVNGFVEPISWKTLLFTLLSLAFMTIFVNGLVMLYRARLHPDRQNQQHHHQQHPQPPPHAPISFPNFAPYHTAYGGYLQPGQPPQHQQQHGIPWHPESDVEGIPRQRRRLENGESTSLGTS